MRLTWNHPSSAGPEAERRLEVHPDVARKFVAAAIADGARIPNPPELDGAFRLALQWAFARLGGDVERF